MIISAINWGNDSAEKDPDLLNYFITTPAYARLLKCQKTFLIGRKGAGKSGLRIRLKQDLQAEGNICIEYSPTYHLINSILSDTETNIKFGKEIFYEYVWLRTLLRKLLIEIGRRPSGTLVNGSLEYARNIAREADQANPDLLESLSTLLSRIKIQAGELGDLGLSIEKVLRKDSDIDVYEYHLSQLLPLLPKCVFIVDDLDLGWDNSPQSNTLLLGLLAAAQYIQTNLHQAHIFVCIRDDMYRLLLRLTTHSDKYRDAEMIKWTDDSLTNLLEERIRFNQKKLGFPTSPDPFSSVFPERIGTNLTVGWLFERTLRRPRELLQHCRIYTESLHAESPDVEMLKKAEEQYSIWKLDDLCSEFVYQYPGLKEVFDFIKREHNRSKYHLSRDELDELLLDTLARCSLNEKWFGDLRLHTNIEEFAKVLFYIGFIGDFLLGGSGGSRIVYSYDDIHTPIFKEVQIHPCFRKAIGTVSRIKRKSAEGTEEEEIEGAKA